MPPGAWVFLIGANSFSPPLPTPPTLLPPPPLLPPLLPLLLPLPADRALTGLLLLDKSALVELGGGTAAWEGKGEALTALMAVDLGGG